LVMGIMVESLNGKKRQYSWPILPVNNLNIQLIN
jgi:hypothetical protein